ncbi:DUF1120 domain-containing protein [Dyella sp. M7H15-1]|uniref:DUF1120 domain-containing protein n=1 Tax=Dyella sp. M7H15-1 TaxID=2501295 RepID=UPI0013E8CD24|nr:DUF1120 domain-containing protein [Dyella sp. M7H15-1]
MNKISKTLLASALALTASTVFAESVDFTVSGTISPSACVPTLSGSFDFGVINSTELKDVEGGVKRAPTKTVDFRIDCTAPTSFMMVATDNKAGTVSDSVTALSPYFFGLGQANGKNIGGYKAELGHAFGDGTLANVYLATDSSASSWVQSLAVNPNDYYRFGTSENSYNSYSTVMATLTVLPYLDASLDFGDEITMDGSATIEIKYL